MKERAAHWTHAMLGAVALAVAASVALAFRHADDPVAELRLDVGELRARAAELALLADAADRDRVPAVTLRSLATQIGRQAQDVAASIAKRRDVRPDEASAAAKAGSALIESSIALANAADAAVARQALPALRRSADELERIDRALGGP